MGPGISNAKALEMDVLVTLSRLLSLALPYVSWR